MELFERARTVRLQSHHDKYLYTDEDEAHVVQDRNTASPNTRWVVEPVPHSPGVTAACSASVAATAATSPPPTSPSFWASWAKVLQTLPHRLGSSVEWVPACDDAGSNAHAPAAQLQTRYSNKPLGTGTSRYPGVAAPSGSS